MTDVNVKYGDNAAGLAGKLLSAARKLDLDVGVVQFSPDGHFQVPEEVADKAKVSYDALDEPDEPAPATPEPAEEPDESDEEPEGGPEGQQEPAGDPKDSDGGTGDGANVSTSVEAPKKNASRDAWAEYATSQGAPEEETKSQDDGGSDRAALIAKYGPKE